MSTYVLHLAIIVGIYIILAISLNLAVGYTGLMNLGHIAFYGIGAYTSAILSLRGWPFLASFVAGGCLAAGMGFLLTAITSRLRGDYFALATLGFSFVIYSVFLNWTQITRGPLGIPGIPRPVIFGWSITSIPSYFLLVVAVASAAVLFIFRLVSSPYGKLLQAVRDEPTAAMVMGKNVFRLKYQSMSMAAFLAGLAGSLYAHYIRFIDPGSFFLSDIIIAFTIIIVGGLASLRGTILASIIIIITPELLRFTPLPPELIGPVRQILYATVLILILLFRPRGIFGKVDLE